MAPTDTETQEVGNVVDPDQDQLETAEPTDDTGDKEVKKAEKVDAKSAQGRNPSLREGTRVQVIDGDYAGRMGVIIRVEYASTEAYLQANTPGHPDRPFAEVAEYIVRTRDAQNITIGVAPEDLKQLDVIDGWARGQV